MTVARLDLPSWYGDFIRPAARYRAVHGGRGSGKSYTLAAAMVIRCMEEPLRCLAARESQTATSETTRIYIEWAIEQTGTTSRWVQTRNQFVYTGVGGWTSSILLFGLERNIPAIRGLARIGLMWLDEAQYHSHESAAALVPTITRTAGSELWYSWNPTYESDWIHERFMRSPRADDVILEVNFDKNPWFAPSEPERAANEATMSVAMYRHFWLGALLPSRYEAYMDMVRWRDLAAPMSVIEGARCYVGVDMGTRDDLSAVCATFKIETDGMSAIVYQEWTIFATTVSYGRNAKQLASWRDDLVILDGPGQLQDAVRDRIAQYDERYSLHEVAFDPTAFEPIEQYLADNGIPSWRYPQGARGMDVPMGILEDIVEGGEYRHAGHPVATWMMGNVESVENADGFRKPVKIDGERGRLKIDGAIAAFMSLASAMKDDGL